jgi:FkbM family methyltransferase
LDNAISHDLVFDVGAHRGEDSEFYLKLGYRVVGIEANPELAAELRARFRDEMGQGRYAVVDKAISDTPGTISFFINKKLSVWGTADPAWAKRNQGMGADSEEIKVPSIRFAEVIEQHGCPHYLKIDVEGADMLCVRALLGTPSRPTYISVESNKISWRGLLDEFDTFERLGYRRFKVIDQRLHRNGNYKARNGTLVSHTFVGGTTGPFGDDLDGPWLTRQQAIRTYIPIFLLYKTLGDNTLLSKLLKNVPIFRRLVDKVSWYDTHAWHG